MATQAMSPERLQLLAILMGFGFVVVMFAFGLSACSSEGRQRLREIIGLPANPRPRVRIRPDGWIRHDGRPFPFGPNVVVEIIQRGGEQSVSDQAEYSSFWPEAYWEWRAQSWRRNILFYRMVRLPKAREIDVG
jgi:hypothetical protein